MLQSMIFCTTPALRLLAEREAYAGTAAAGTVSASMIADRMAAVSQIAREYQITMDAVRG
ncbi:hypothetical protein [Mycobacterium tuberculosis]|nr:hypothetical protein [Mycobacterium tuberculosis]